MLPLSEGWVYQRTPVTVPFYLRVRNGSYPNLDMTTVTSVVCEVYLPGSPGTAVTWTFLPVVGEMTTETAVVVRYFAVGDTDKLGKITIHPTPMVGAIALVPARPIVLPVRQRAPL